ncbi:hypothetical protein CASFOL_024408 [Castilleja foliolosa]|uniref:Uncharacterized protein n=1 Tax=Castilleja foliolosa TaxID=1961234 RepID=A0ABD3CPE5_9LAMI
MLSEEYNRDKPKLKSRFPESFKERDRDQKNNGQHEDEKASNNPVPMAQGNSKKIHYSGPLLVPSR